jgi:hypothetical protein
LKVGAKAAKTRSPGRFAGSGPGKPLDRTPTGILENAMRARIYRPARNAMQSGRARTKQWLLEYEPETPRTIDPLMGWTSSKDMRQQLNLEFDTAEEAVAYAQAHGIPYQLFEPHLPTPKPKAYSDNFRFDRRVPWSH